MFNHKHYVPILKGKAGEYQALSTLPPTIKSSMTPLIEVPSIPWDFTADVASGTIDDHLEDVAENIDTTWGKTLLFVDLTWMDPADRMADGRHPVTYVFDEMRARGIEGIPVTGLARDPAYQTAVAGVVATDGRGVCIRIEETDFEDVANLQPSLDAVLAQLGLSPSATDILLDFGSIAPSQSGPLLLAARSVINGFPYLPDWRTLTFAATAFPLNLSSVPALSIIALPRAEWTLWRNLISGPIARRPTFGDYAINHPEPEEFDPRFMSPSASIRYTLSDTWLILKARGARRFGFGQFRSLCSALTARADYYGQPHCWGDDFIQQCANNTVGTGNLTTWRKVGTAHHLTVVVGQIASLP